MSPQGGDLPFHIDKGQGDTAVFLLHGVGGGHQAFDDTLPALLKAGYRVIAWDAPGYGSSALPGGAGPLSMASMAAALVRLVRHVGAARSVVLGHSMGGMIAQEAMAQGQGTGIDGLVLFATSPAFGKPGGDWQKQFLASRFAALDAGLGMAGLAPVLAGGMMAMGSPPRVRANAVRMMSAVPEATYREALAAIVSFDRLANLPHIGVPTLCLACDEDKTAPPAVMEKMAGKIPGAQYQCLAHAGHLGNLEQPEAFNNAVLAFLARHFPNEEA